MSQNNNTMRRVRDARKLKKKILNNHLYNKLYFNRWSWRNDNNNNKTKILSHD